MEAAKFSGESPPLTLLIALSLLLASATTAANALTDQEIDTAIEALRFNNYSLFGNAIATSNLRRRLLSGHSFTLFSPPDSELFRLDMSFAASDYVRTLSHHISPRRLSLADLRDLSLVSHLESLLPHHRLLIANHRVSVDGTVSKYVTINAVRITVPNLYLGSKIAVHGLDGILSASFQPTEKFSCDLGLVSPKAWPGECVSPISSNFDPDSSAPPEGNESPEKTGQLSFRKHQEENWQEILDHRQNYVHDEIKHGKFSKYNHHLPL